MASKKEEAKKHVDVAQILFCNEEWMEAEHFLSKAIALRPNVPSFYVNRAHCNMMRKNWLLVEEDCRKVIELKPTKYARAYLLLGRTLRQFNDLGEAVQVLEKGLDLSIQYSELQDEVRTELFMARYKLWESKSATELSELHILRQACHSALEEKHGIDSSHLKSLQAVFANAFEAHTPKEVPDFLCCPITYDIFCDPVILPNGITYERKSILKHFQEAGFVDPIARTPLDLVDLVPNLAIKAAAEDFLRRNGWANEREYFDL